MSQYSKNFESLEINTLYEVSKILSSSLNLSNMLNQLVKVISIHIEVQHIVVCLLNAQRQLETIVSLGSDVTALEESPAASHILQKIFKHGLPMIIQDISDETSIGKSTLLHQSNKKNIAMLGVPIKQETECIGVLAIYFDRSPSFAGFQSMLRLFTVIARLIGQRVALDQYMLREQNKPKDTGTGSCSVTIQHHALADVIGRSSSMKKVLAEVYLAAPGNSTILLRGESGTGKEAIARAIHALSPRNKAPFIKTNCAALSENLLESELFGHEKGAFTGATHERAGRFEQADGGTLFLDEIGDISPSFQVKLLRVLQEREFERVGGNKTIKINVRIICATHRNLEEEIKQGRFRADLYYRINVISIHLPPLRERKEDIPLLTAHILNHHNQTNATNIQLTERAIQVLMQCQWPGNVRELENCIARSCTLSRSQLIDAEAIPCQSGQCMSASLWKKQAQTTAAEGATLPLEILSERDRLINMMEKNGWVQAKAARALNLTPRQVAYALKKHRITIKKF